MGTRAQGQFAHATAPGSPTIVVAQAKAARYNHICASEPENVNTLLTAPHTKSACWHSTAGRQPSPAGFMFASC